MWSDPRNEKMEPPHSPQSPVMLSYPTSPIIRQDSGCGFTTVDIGHCTRQDHPGVHHQCQPSSQLHRADSVHNHRDTQPHILTRHISQSREFIMEDDERYFRELKSYTKRHNLFILLLCLTLIGGGFILLYFTLLPGRTVMGQSQLGMSPYCVPCSSLTISSDPMDDPETMGVFDTNTELDGTVNCCASNHTQLSALLDLMVEKKFREHEVSAPEAPQPQIGAPPPVHNDTSAPPLANTFSAQLFLESPPDEMEPDGRQVIRGWAHPNTHDDQNFVRNGLGYISPKGRIQIRSTGLYTVYSHLVFRPPHDVKHALFSQHVMKENAGSARIHKQKLLEDEEMVTIAFPDQPSLPCYTSHLSSQLYLKKGDEIFIEVTHADRLVANRRSSYFGLYRLSD